MILYRLSSFGIICAVQPCTNPCATLTSSTIGILVAGNVTTHYPCPRAVKVSQFLTAVINETIRSISSIGNLIVTLHESLMGLTTEAMSHPDVDLVVRTGGSGSLRQAMASGKEMIGAGSASPVAIMDAATNLEGAARDIIGGASLDSNLICTLEKCMAVEESVSDRFMYELLKDGVHYVRSGMEVQKLLNAAVTEDFVISKKLEGRGAKEILEYAGISASKAIGLIVAETGRMHPFIVTELMMPLVPLVKVVDFDEALEIALEVERGYKHTATIHSGSVEYLNRAARELQTSVFVKDGPSLMRVGFDKEGHTSFTIATTTGEGAIMVRHFARRRRHTLTSGFPIH